MNAADIIALVVVTGLLLFAVGLVYVAFFGEEDDE